MTQRSGLTSVEPSKASKLLGLTKMSFLEINIVNNKNNMNEKSHWFQKLFSFSLTHKSAIYNIIFDIYQQIYNLNPTNDKELNNKICMLEIQQLSNLVFLAVKIMFYVL